jgi:hypothetical protein
MTIGMKAGESVQDYVKRLESAMQEKAKSEKKLSWKLSDKGVVVLSFGTRGFPTSMTVERLEEVLASTDLAAFVKKEGEKIKAKRAEYVKTPEYLANQAKINAERAAFTAAKAKTAWFLQGPWSNPGPHEAITLPISTRYAMGRQDDLDLNFLRDEREQDWQNLIDLLDGYEPISQMSLL